MFIFNESVFLWSFHVIIVCNCHNCVPKIKRFWYYNLYINCCDCLNFINFYYVIIVDEASIHTERKHILYYFTVNILAHFTLALYWPWKLARCVFLNCLWQSMVWYRPLLKIFEKFEEPSAFSRRLVTLSIMEMARMYLTYCRYLHIVEIEILCDVRHEFSPSACFDHANNEKQHQVAVISCFNAILHNV